MFAHCYIVDAAGGVRQPDFLDSRAPARKTSLLALRVVNTYPSTCSLVEPLTLRKPLTLFPSPHRQPSLARHHYASLACFPAVFGSP